MQEAKPAALMLYVDVNVCDLLCIKPKEIVARDPKKVSPTSHRISQNDIANKDFTAIIKKLGYNPNSWRFVNFYDSKWMVQPSRYNIPVLFYHSDFKVTVLQQRNPGDKLLRVCFRRSRWSTFLHLKPQHDDITNSGIYSKLIRVNNDLFRGCDIEHYNDQRYGYSARIDFPSGDFPIKVCVVDVDNQSRSRTLSINGSSQVCDLLETGEMIIGSQLYSSATKVEYYSEGISKDSSFVDLGLVYFVHASQTISSQYTRYQQEGTNEDLLPMYTLFVVSDDWCTRPKQMYTYFSQSKERSYTIHASSYQSAWIIYLGRGHSMSEVITVRRFDGLLIDNKEMNLNECELDPAFPFFVWGC